ncbi:hypothetical protein C8R43DRAFT_1123686 [Mycena crocata]|nr:hypothetical protein C8R43DRAFT_1123686 [Mycena crocata]
MPIPGAVYQAAPAASGPLLCSPTYFPAKGHEDKSKHTEFWAVTADAGDFVGVLSSKAAFEKLAQVHPNLKHFKAASWSRVLELWSMNCGDYHNHENEQGTLPAPPYAQPIAARPPKVITHFLPHNFAAFARNYIPEPLVPESPPLEVVNISDDEEEPAPPPKLRSIGDMETRGEINAEEATRLTQEVRASHPPYTLNSGAYWSPTQPAPADYVEPREYWALKKAQRERLSQESNAEMA